MGVAIINFDKTPTAREMRESDISSLRYAVMRDSKDEFEKFLKNSRWLTYSWDDYEWALRIAAKEGKLDAVIVLVEAKTNIHSKDEYALRWAAENNHTKIVRYLVKKGADISALFPSVRLKYNLKEKE